MTFKWVYLCHLMEKWSCFFTFFFLKEWKNFKMCTFDVSMWPLFCKDEGLYITSTLIENSQTDAASPMSHVVSTTTTIIIGLRMPGTLTFLEYTWKKLKTKYVKGIAFEYLLQFANIESWERPPDTLRRDCVWGPFRVVIKWVLAPRMYSENERGSFSLISIIMSNFYFFSMHIYKHVILGVIWLHKLHT